MRLFAFSVALSLVLITELSFGQEFSVGTRFEWSPLNESWKLSEAMVVSSPKFGKLFRSSVGGIYYENIELDDGMDSFTLLVNSTGLTATVDVTVDVGTGLISYEYVGTGTAVSSSGSSEPSKPISKVPSPSKSSPVDAGFPSEIRPMGEMGAEVKIVNSSVVGTVVGLPGSLAPIPRGGTVQVFVSDNTVSYDAPQIAIDLGSKGVSITSDVGNWYDVLDRVGKTPGNSIDVLVLAGHGSTGGGIATLNKSTHLRSDNISQTMIDLLKSRLADDATVFVLGCDQAVAPHVDGIQALADKLGLPVIVNNDSVVTGTKGSGTWVRIDPKPSK